MWWALQNGYQGCLGGDEQRYYKGGVMTHRARLIISCTKFPGSLSPRLGPSMERPLSWVLDRENGQDESIAPSLSSSKVSFSAIIVVVIVGCRPWATTSTVAATGASETTKRADSRTPIRRARSPTRAGSMSENEWNNSGIEVCRH